MVLRSDSSAAIGRANAIPAAPAADVRRKVRRLMGFGMGVTLPDSGLVIFRRLGIYSKSFIQQSVLPGGNRRMKTPSIVAVCLLTGAGFVLIPRQAQPQEKPAAKAPLYNTTKQKLLQGKQVFSFTQMKFDIPGYCEAAKHYDYAWFELQPRTLEF